MRGDRSSFSLAALGIEFMGVNLHKWMGVPLGVGAMYIRRDRIADIDPFMANDEVPATDIRARAYGHGEFRCVFTVPDALDFHEQVGGDGEGCAATSFALVVGDTAA